MGFSGGSEGKESTCNAGDLSSIPGSGRSSGEENGTHFSILAWIIPRTEKPGGLQSMGTQRDEHNWVIFTYLYTQEIMIEQWIWNCQSISTFGKRSNPRTPINWNWFPRPRHIIIFEKALNRMLYRVPGKFHILVFPGKAQRRKCRGDPNPSCSVTREAIEDSSGRTDYPHCDRLLMSI